MSVESEANVTLKNLLDLQSDLTSLSQALLECYEVLDSNISALSEKWQDEKFDEFEASFRTRKEQIMFLSEKYNMWATQYMPPRIDVIKEALGTSVGK